MAGLIRYLILANFFLLVMALFYKLALSRETKFITNRFILIFGTMASLIVPLFHFNWLPGGSYSILTIPEIIVTAKSTMAHFNIEEIQIIGTAPFVFPWLKLSAILYITGITSMSILLLWRIKKIQFWTKTYPMKWVQNLYITVLPENWSPFSFLGIAYFPRPFNKLDHNTKMILEHEKVHIDQKHSWDVLFIEIIKLLFFYNPAVYTIKKQIQINHEFIVDSRIVGDQPKVYSQELIRSQFQVPQFQFIQQFNQTSFLKKRILMLTKNKTNSLGLLKYMLMVPVIGGLLWISACTEEAEPSIQENQNPTALDIKAMSAVGIYTQTILDSEYSEMNKLEKHAKVIAVEMKKTGVSEENINSFMEKSISSWAINNADVLKESLLFKSTGFEFEDIEIVPVEIEKKLRLVADITAEDSEVFYIVEEMPEFQGGELQEFKNWVQSNVKYPSIAAQNGIHGTVYANFVVDKSGAVISVKIIRGVDPCLDNEVIRVLESAPLWTPGKQRGQNVKVAMSLPIKFNLD